MVIVLYLVNDIIQVYENELLVSADTPAVFLSVFVSCFRCRNWSESGSVGSWVLAICPELSSYNPPPIRPPKLNLQDIWVRRKKKSHCTNFYLFLYCNIACRQFDFLSVYTMLSFNIWLYYVFCGSVVMLILVFLHCCDNYFANFHSWSACMHPLVIFNPSLFLLPPTIAVFA